MDRNQWIECRAYAIWVERGRPDGRALEHWLEAEAEFARRPIDQFLDPYSVVPGDERPARAGSSGGR